MGDYYWWGAKMLVILSLLVHSSNAFCPDGCACDEDLLHVTCVQSKLEVRLFDDDYDHDDEEPLKPIRRRTCRDANSIFLVLGNSFQQKMIHK